MQTADITRYDLELDILERDPTLSTLQATELLRSDFALALNASYLMALSGDAIDVTVSRRWAPQ